MAHPIHQANSKSPFGNLTQDEFYQKHNILHEESSFTNHQNLRIFTQSWRPGAPGAASSASRPLGLVAMIHGYSSESGWVFQTTAVAVAKQNFHVVALDLQGHGRSEGPTTHLPSMDPLVSDCIRFFDSVRSSQPHLPAFLYGESLGGAIAMLVAIQQKHAWKGIVLNGAMCGLSRKVMPVWPLENFLPMMALLAPGWRAVFAKSLVEKSYKLKWKRELARNSPHARCTEHPTYATAAEMKRLVAEIESKCGELEAPLLVVHGKDDQVCDCESAEFVFHKAGSQDKSLKVLDGMWHQLVGETEENVEVGFALIFDWLKERAKRVDDHDKLSCF